MFQPKGSKALWKYIYEAIVDDTVGTILTFDGLSKIIGSDIRENRGALYKARVKLAKEKKRYLISEYMVGYKIVEGADQLRHAELRHDKAQNQIKLASFEAVNLNTKVMSADEKARWQSFLAWNSMAINALSQNTAQVAKVNAVANIATNVMEDQLSQMQKDLREYSGQMQLLMKRVS